MDVRVILIAILCILLCLVDYTIAESELLGKTCPDLEIEHGNVTVRPHGKLASVECHSNFTLIDGNRHLSCKAGGRWEATIPKCVGIGCQDIGDIPYGYTISDVGGAVKKFVCNIGFMLVGSTSLSCNGSDWNSTVPSCTPGIDPDQVALSCNFEEDWCNWKVEKAVSSWRRRAGGPVPPGSSIPTTDHTTGNVSGHFLFIDASESHNNYNLHSPVFPVPVDNTTCFVFYYHFKAHTTGNLSLHLKNEDSEEKTVALVLTGDSRKNHVNDWSMAYIDITHILPSHSQFHLILELMPGSGYKSDVAIDDVTLTSGSSCFKHAREWQEQEDAQSISFSTTTQQSHLFTEDESLNNTSSTSSSFVISTLITEHTSTQPSMITQKSSESINTTSLSTATQPSMITQKSSESINTTSLSTATQPSMITQKSSESINTTSLSTATQPSMITQKTSESINTISLSTTTQPSMITQKSSKSINTTTSSIATHPSMITQKSSESINTTSLSTATQPSMITHKSSESINTTSLSTATQSSMITQKSSESINTTSLSTNGISNFRTTSIPTTAVISATSVSKGTKALLIALFVVVSGVIICACITLKRKKKKKKIEYKTLLSNIEHEEGSKGYSTYGQRESEVSVSYKSSSNEEDESVQFLTGDSNI